jgi:hypothetical protein
MILQPKQTLQETFQRTGPILFPENDISTLFIQVWLAKSFFFQKDSEIKLQELFGKYNSEVEFLKKNFLFIPYYHQVESNFLKYCNPI